MDPTCSSKSIFYPCNDDVVLCTHKVDDMLCTNCYYNSEVDYNKKQCKLCENKELLYVCYTCYNYYNPNAWQD